MKKLIWLWILLPTFASADSIFMKGEPTLKNGVYQRLVFTELKFVRSESMVKICGLNHFPSNSLGYISRAWTLMGSSLYSGRVKEGDYEDGKILVRMTYQVGGQTQNQTLVLLWNEEQGTFTYELKDSYVGGYQVEGVFVNNPSPELLEHCK